MIKIFLTTTYGTNGFLKNKFTAMLGALNFFNYAKFKGVEIFYVSGRDQGKGTFKNALGNLTALKFPYADKEHMFIITES